MKLSGLSSLERFYVSAFVNSFHICNWRQHLSGLAVLDSRSVSGRCMQGRLQNIHEFFNVFGNSFWRGTKPALMDSERTFWAVTEKWSQKWNIFQEMSLAYLFLNLIDAQMGTCMRANKHYFFKLQYLENERVSDDLFFFLSRKCSYLPLSTFRWSLYLYFWNTMNIYFITCIYIYTQSDG